MTDRRSFLKKAAVAAASAIAAPGILKAENSPILSAERATTYPGQTETGGLIVPMGQGLRITGTFLDEISHDIPHQNWGEKEWDADFRHMKSIGIDTVIVIRSTGSS